jgi:hypothetical protein
MKNQKVLIRRTFSQERFDILIKKQRNGNASFKDLTELDDIVNRDPAIRGSIMEEMQGTSNPPQPPPRRDELVFNEPAKHQNLLEQVKKFLNRLFIIQTGGLNTAL